MTGSPEIISGQAVSQQIRPCVRVFSGRKNIFFEGEPKKNQKIFQFTLAI